MPTFPSAPLWRRLAALGYDSLLLGAVMFVSVGLLVWLYQFTGLPMVELNGVAKPPAWFAEWVIRGVLLLLIVGFYGYFWRHGGQSLGMRAWRIRTERQDQRRLSWGQVLVRCAVGLGTFGIGFLLVPLSHKGQALQDMASNTRTVLIPKDN